MVAGVPTRRLDTRSDRCQRENHARQGWALTGTLTLPYHPVQTNVLNFTPEFLGRVRLVGSLASLAGVAIFNTWLKVRAFDREAGLQGCTSCGAGVLLVLVLQQSSCCMVGPQCNGARAKHCGCWCV